MRMSEKKIKSRGHSAGSLKKGYSLLPGTCAKSLAGMQLIGKSGSAQNEIRSIKQLIRRISIERLASIFKELFTTLDMLFSRAD